MIRILLTVLLLFGLVFAVREWRQSRALAYVTIMLVATGVALVWQDSLATRLANFLSVGRGADLILYLYTAISFVLIVSLLIRIRNLHEQLTELARSIALSRPRMVTTHSEGTNGRAARDRETTE